jgi:hypothetical protein
MTEEQTEKPINKALKAISLESVVSGFQAYRETYKKVLLAPRQFASQELLPDQPGILQSAISIYLYGIAISFFMYVPLVQWHDLKLGKIYFLVQFLYFQFLVVCLVYLSVRIFRGRGTLSQTAAAYCTWMGIISPVAMIIGYPLFFYVPITDFIDLQEIDTNSLSPWVQWWIVFGVIGLVSVGFLTFFQWIADLHKIRKRRLLLAMIFVYGPIMEIHNQFLAPFVSRGLHVFSDILEKL